MNLRSNLVKAMIFAFALALYDMFFKQTYILWLEARGIAGIAGVALGYFTAIVVAMLLSWTITRRMI